MTLSPLFIITSPPYVHRRTHICNVESIKTQPVNSLRFANALAVAAAGVVATVTTPNS